LKFFIPSFLGLWYAIWLLINLLLLII
jgi:hypothetical protein